MLIDSKEKSKKQQFILIAIVVFILVIALKWFLEFKTNILSFNSNSTEDLQSVEVPVSIPPKLYTENLLDIDKNKIYQKENLSLYLNNELGTPTLMVMYSDSLTALEKDGRFLAFLYLKDPSEWRAINKKYDHILLTKETLIPIQKVIDDTTRHIFKFRLEHPYFNIENLKKLEFVRHSRAVGRFEEIIFEKDSSHYIYPVSNTLKKLQISVTQSDLDKITRKRNNALKSGVLVTNDTDYVNAQIAADDQSTNKASIRLKGDWTDHLEHPNKWSYRIVPNGENTMFGMRKFSVQHPKARNYIWEWLFNKVVKDNDLVGLRYDFLNVDLKIKDKDSIIPMGIMALEESFDKILIENNRRREGLILGLDETAIWAERKKVKELKLDYPKDVDLPKFYEMPVKVYNENKVLTSPVLSKQFKIGKSLVEGLLNGKLNLSDSFDTDKLAFYIALSNLFGGHHGLFIENIRMYYNPVTNKLEPISFDSNSGTKIDLLRVYPIGRRDPVFKEKLIAAYEKVTSQEFIDDLIAKYQDQLNDYTLNLSTEFADATMDLSVIQYNANFIKKTIFPSRILSSSFISFEAGNMQIELKNHTKFPVVVDGLVLENGKSLNRSQKNLVIAPGDTLKHSFFVKKEFDNAFVSKKNKEGGFRYPKDLVKIRIKYHISGSKAKRYNAIRPYTSAMDAEMIAKMRPTNNLSNFQFITVDENQKIALFKSGAYILDTALYIPTGYTIHIEPGFSLDLVNKASLISYAPIFSNGTKEKPINFTSKDNTGGGIFISSTDTISVLRHTNFINLSVPNLDIWQLSGAVNFNEARVSISNCTFESNRSEDALNIIRTSFELDSSRFVNTYSDSFDGDFVTGSITNSTFINSGNDGIDVSGSELELKNIRIENPSDKGLSAGEDSVMNGSNITISDGEIAIVSKDLSRINLSNITIENTRLGMACFQKKTEFGPGIIDLKEITLKGVEITHLIEPSSNLIIDSRAVTDKSKNVIDLMYGNEYGKSSR